MDILEQAGEVGKYKEHFLLWPERWDQYNRIHNCEWERVEFRKSQASDVPDEPGVYNFVIEPGIACHPSCAYLMYVGETGSLEERFRDYISEKDNSSGRPKVLKMLNYWEGYIKFYYIEVQENEKEKVEEEMISAFIPPYNDQITGDVSSPVNAFRT